MFGSKAVSIVSKSLLALTLASGLALSSSRPAEASMTDAYLACGEGTETAYFGFPLAGAGRMSIFAYRIDSGAWNYTAWYYMRDGSYWQYEAGRGWVALPADSSMTMLVAGNNRVVEGYEYRYNPSTGSGSWINLGWCRTTSFFESGITFN